MTDHFYLEPKPPTDSASEREPRSGMRAGTFAKLVAEARAEGRAAGYAAGQEAMRDRLEQMEQALKRGIGAIEACAMQGRGIPVNWDAINATQDEMRAALAAEPGERAT